MHDRLGGVVAVPPERHGERERRRGVLRVPGPERADRGQLPVEAEPVRGRGVQRVPLQVDLLRAVLRVHGEEVPWDGRCVRFR